MFDHSRIINDDNGDDNIDDDEDDNDDDNNNHHHNNNGFYLRSQKLDILSHVTMAIMECYAHR